MSDNPTNVSGYPISKSFKGILRISNNIEAGNYNDLSNVDSYTDNYNDWNQNGTQTVLEALNAGNRYISSDEYINLKLPVSDSMGNILNFSLGGLNSNNTGSNGSSVGFMEEVGRYIPSTVQFESSDKTTYPAIETANVLIGYDKELINKLPSKNGKLYIDSYNEHPGILMIKNKYYHESKSDEDSYKIVPVPDKVNVRTIFQDKASTIKKFDAFIYQQENYQSHVDDDKNLNIDCYVSVKNLKDYADHTFATYLGYNTAEIPTGSIIWQYSSLDKWICRSQTNSNIINELEWQGYLPSMSGSIFPGSVIDGVYANDTYLEYNSEISNELPPDFKRGYALCDGSSKSIRLFPGYLAKKFKNTETYRKALKLFYNLFYTIGYYYTDQVLHRKIKKYSSTDVDGKKVVKYRYDYNLQSGIYKWGYQKSTSISRDTLYAINMALINMFNTLDKIHNDDALYRQLAIDNNLNKNLDRVKVLNWLKKQSIDADYIFNAIYDNKFSNPTGRNAYFKYANYYLNIGTEINSFEDEIPYYYYDQNDNIQYTTTEIWNTAEAYDIISLFCNDWTDYSPSLTDPNGAPYSEDNLTEAWALYKISFAVPKMYSDSNGKQYGLFPGSNGLSLSTSFKVQDRFSGITSISASEIQYKNYQSPMHSSLDAGDIPHYHYVGLASTTGLTLRVNGNTEYGLENTGTLDDTNKYLINCVLNKYSSSWESFNDSRYLNQYVLQNIPATFCNTNVQEYNITFSGCHGTAIESYSPKTYYWYGKTSASKYDRDPGVVNRIFRPESILLLPLIKL